MIDTAEQAASVDPFGFGAGVIVPGFGVGNAFDNIAVTNTATASTVAIFNTGAAVNLVTVNVPVAADFQQTTPPLGDVNEAGLIVNAGFETGLRPTPDDLIADNITANISPLFYTRVNGGDPTLTLDPATGILAATNSTSPPSRATSTSSAITPSFRT